MLRSQAFGMRGSSVHCGSSCPHGLRASHPTGRPLPSTLCRATDPTRLKEGFLDDYVEPGTPMRQQPPEGHASEEPTRRVLRAVPNESMDGTSYSSSSSGLTRGAWEARQRNRSVFSFKRWHAHRETTRYMRHIQGILSSATFHALSTPLSFLTANATVVALYEWCVENHYLPPDFPTLQLDDQPFALTSFALSLLLVFRTDASYARWNEALSAWSEVRSTAKEIVRFSVIWIKAPELQRILQRWTVAFPRTLQVYLREHGDIRSQMSGVLLPHELERLEAAENYPHYVLHVLTEVVERASLSEIREDMLLVSIGRFSNAIGVCEKILRYPIPLAYTRHTSRFMTIWLALLPFSLWHGCKWATIPIIGFIAFLLLGIEEIGVQIEEPFSLLPVEDVCADIERDISAIMRSKDSVRELVAMDSTQYVDDTRWGFDDHDGGRSNWEAPGVLKVDTAPRNGGRDDGRDNGAAGRGGGAADGASDFVWGDAAPRAGSGRGRGGDAGGRDSGGGTRWDTRASLGSWDGGGGGGGAGLGDGSSFSSGGGGQGAGSRSRDGGDGTISTRRTAPVAAASPAAARRDGGAGDGGGKGEGAAPCCGGGGGGDAAVCTCGKSLVGAGQAERGGHSARRAG